MAARSKRPALYMGFVLLQVDTTHGYRMDGVPE